MIILLTIILFISIYFVYKSDKEIEKLKQELEDSLNNAVNYKKEAVHVKHDLFIYQKSSNEKLEQMKKELASCCIKEEKIASVKKPIKKQVVK